MLTTIFRLLGGNWGRFVASVCSVLGVAFLSLSAEETAVPLLPEGIPLASAPSAVGPVAVAEAGSTSIFAVRTAKSR
jgi:hypothetical protein